MTQTLEVATTILAQLGGMGRLRAMLGAHSFTGGKDRLTFKFKAKAQNGINAIVVILDSHDTYTVEFWAWKTRNGMKNFERAGCVDDVYCDRLRSVIETMTGLRLSL